MNAKEPESTAGIIINAPPAEITRPKAILFLYPNLFRISTLIIFEA